MTIETHLSRSAVVAAPDSDVREPGHRAIGRLTAGPGQSDHGPPALSAAFAVSLLALAAGYAFGVDGLRLVGVLGALFLGVGTAPLQLFPAPSLAARLGVACLIGFVTATGIGALMVLLPLWYPVPVAALLGAIAVCVHLVSVRRALAADSRRALRISARTFRPPSRSLACTTLGTALWLAAAVAAGHVSPGVGGFLTQISPAWYVGLILVLAGIALGRHDRQAHLALGVLSLALATTLTPALLYGMPRTSSAAKHMDLVLAILRQHHLNPSSDHDPVSAIYLTYSGLFAGVAWILRLARVSSPIGIATYWPVLLALVRVIELRFLVGRLVSSRYRCWVAVLLAVLVDSLGADYFSPQSAGFVMGLALFALAVEGPGEPGLDTRLVAPLLVLSGYAMAVTHELSPFMVGGMLLVLAVLGQARPRWAPIALLGPAAAWALQFHSVIGSFFSLSTVFSFRNLFPPQTAVTPGLHRLAITNLSSDALIAAQLALIGLALVGLIRNRNQRWAWAFILCPGVGLGLTLINPYGYEGIFRSTLFAIPWLAVLAAHAGGPERRAWLGRLRWGPRAAQVTLFLTSVGLMAAFFISAYGLDEGRVLLRSDWAARLWFERHAPQHSFLLPIGFGENPVSTPLFPPRARVVSWGRFVGRSLLRPGHPVAADVALLTAGYERYATRRSRPYNPILYADWSPKVPTYEREYGLQTYAQAKAWLDLLLVSGRWQTVYARGGSYVLRLTSTGSDRTGSS
jgi:hypothetical protein